MKARATLVAVALIAAGGLYQAHGAVPICSDHSAVGGEWRTYGHDWTNDRFQPAEDTINKTNAMNLAPKWVFHTTDGDAQGGGIDGTPVVADGCVFLASSTGKLFALDAGNGALLWVQTLLGNTSTLTGDVITGSPTVVDEPNGDITIYVGVYRSNNGKGPYVAALDGRSGDILWQSTIEHNQSGAGTIATPVVFNGMLFQGFLGPENTQGLIGSASNQPRGGFAILDASRTCNKALFAAPVYPTAIGTVLPNSDCFNDGGSSATGGKIKAHTYTIDDQDFADGYRGASVWCTGAFDPVDKNIYACGGNPASKKLEARYSNALLKIDADPSRATFGQIVDAYKGNVDQYYPGADRQPVCDQFGTQLGIIWSQSCLQLDLDFGAAPHLFKDSAGRLILGDLQKSGVYHAVFADKMQADWSAIVGPPCFACNASSPAHDATNAYAVGTPPGQMVALKLQGGRYAWNVPAEPVADGTHFESVSAANGVVYTIDNAGFLNMFAADTGFILMRRPLTMDAGAVVANASSSGVAIASHRVYAASSEFLIAYGL